MLPLLPPAPSRSARLALPLLAGSLVVGALPAAALDAPGPVVCTTTLEAPLSSGRGTLSAPVEVTRCGVVRTTPELVTDRYYSWRAPYARGVDVVHQITDLFGIAMGGGRDGNRVMGLGFPDQGITWDGSAIENTAATLLGQQSPDLPLRTADLPGVYGGSVADPARSATCPRPDAVGCAASFSPARRGLW
jgi:hypothetical protein